jgi:hypothetical protein
LVVVVGSDISGRHPPSLRSFLSVAAAGGGGGGGRKGERERERAGEGHGAVMEPLVSVTEFLEQCKVSGDSAYNAVKVVLERLHNPETRVSARVLLAAVEKHVAQEEEKEKERESCGVAVDSMTKYHFRIHQLSLTDYEGILVDLLCVIFAAVHAASCFVLFSSTLSILLHCIIKSCCRSLLTSGVAAS